MIFEIAESGDLTPLVDYLKKVGLDHKIFLFQGDLGAGKTTIVKAIGASLGLGNQMNSPSFGLINDYQTASCDHFYHIDLYRLDDPEEAFDIGLLEVLDSGSICWIEWPDILRELWHSYDTVSVQIEVLNDGSRRIFVS